MPKKIPCACVQGYHYSKTEKTNCRRINDFLPSSSSSIVELQTQHIHHNHCRCEFCQEIRLERLISYFSFPVNRCRLMSQSEISSDQQVDRKQIVNNLRPNDKERLLWDEEKIFALMEKGVGNINSRFLEAIKSHRLRFRKNQTFLRMYLFLNPCTSIIVQDWKEIVKPQQLMLKAEKPIDIRSYRQRVQDRLSSLAKKYKQLSINSNARFRTAQMMEVEEKMDHLSEIVRKFYFIEDHSDLIAAKQQQAWEKNIVILKKGEYHPHQINSFKELKAIAPLFPSPIRKNYKLHLIDKKQQLDRVYEQVRKKAKYYGLIEKPSEHQELELLAEVSKVYIDVRRMDIEQPRIDFKDKEHQQTMEIQANRARIPSAFTHKYIRMIAPSYSRSYLSPLVICKGRSSLLTQEEIAHLFRRSNTQSWSQQKSPRMLPGTAKSKDFSSITVFSAEKSLTQSDWFPEKMQVELPKPLVRQFEPRSNLNLYSLTDINHFPKPPSTKKAFQCMDYQRCSQIGCKQWLKGLIYDCSLCNAAYHKECWPETNFCRICPSISANWQFNFNFTLEGCSQFKIMNKILLPPPQPLYPEETATKIKQIQNNFSNQSYCVTNRFPKDFIIYPFYNAQIQHLHHEDQKIIDEYDKQNLAFPVIVKAINSIKGRGLVACRPIGKGELVATYSGDVISLAQAAKYSEKVSKDYLFHLISGPEVQTNFVVNPSTFASAGFFMNHAHSKSSKRNVKTLIAFHQNKPIILMQATKKIDYGQELLYNYNSEYNVYDTQNFE